MTITGIIAEFNPFHNGHKYLLDQAEGLKIVTMSGNFMQRGEPAIVDKWTRAQMALENGADLVVELPFLVSVQAADFFGQGAVDILARLGIDSLAFGTEEVLDYRKIADLYSERGQEMEQFVDNLPDSLSYPQKTQAMWKEFAGLDFSCDTPNHVLALAYAKAVAGRNIRLHPIQRQGAGYHSVNKDVDFASATAIRQYQADSDFLERFMPSVEVFKGALKVSWEDYFQLLRYQILSNPVNLPDKVLTSQLFNIRNRNNRTFWQNSLNPLSQMIDAMNLTLTIWVEFRTCRVGIRPLNPLN